MNKKNITTLVIIVVVLAFVLVNTFQIGRKAVSENFDTSPLYGMKSITCTYPQTLHTSYLLGKINHELPPPEKNPIIMSYSDLGSQTISIRFIDSTQTISEVQATKVYDDNDKYIFIEGTGDPYLTVHTIYLKSGVSTYTKQASLLGNPVGTIAMGTCLDL